jgi:hypothetical protein
VNVKKKIFSICLSVVVLVALIAVLVPGCTGDGACTGKIEVKATLCDVAWNGTVQYKLTGPGAAAPTIINGTAVPTTHTADCGNWTCEYVSGGPPGAYLVDITPPSPQEVTSGGTITFTLNFEENQDAWIDWLWWTVNDEPLEYLEAEVMPCNIIDVHFVQGVIGCEGRIVAVNETSRLWIHYLGYNPAYPGDPMCSLVPDPSLFVVNDLCAVNKTAEPPANPAEKVSQMTTYWGEPVEPGGPLLLECDLDTEIDVETIWMLEKEIEYTKSINWFGVTLDPGMHPCVLFDLAVLPISGWYAFQLVAEAEVVLMDDEDVNPGNNKAVSPPLLLWVWIP